MIGKTIARLRKRKGLTQAELSALVEVHQSVLARWETNQIQPRTKALERLAAALESTPAEILAGDYAGVSSTFNAVDDPELMDMFGQVGKLNDKEREALKTFLGAMLARVKMEEVARR